jgi:hypothetical protein
MTTKVLSFDGHLFCYRTGINIRSPHPQLIVKIKQELINSKNNKKRIFTNPSPYKKGIIVHAHYKYRGNTTRRLETEVIRLFGAN